jgi:hypothetical protein
LTPSTELLDCDLCQYRLRARPTEITESRLVLVEGYDEVVLISKYLKRAGIVGVHVWESGGKDKFEPYLNGLVTTVSGFDRVKTLGIIRDADDDPASAFASIRNTLRKCQLPFPTRPSEFATGKIEVGVFIVPSGTETGCLEGLCLASRADVPALRCVESFFDCVKTDTAHTGNSLLKAKCQVYMATHPDLPYRAGIAALKGVWDLDHPCFTQLGAFLKRCAGEL